MINKLVLIAGVIMLASCAGNSNQQPVKDNSSPAPAIKEQDLHPFDLIEQLFQNDNWLVLDGNDSSYLYCSRLGKAYVKTYYFKMFKGDSVHTVIDTMQYTGNAITWRLPADTISLQLTNSTADSLGFTNIASGNAYQFIKKDSTHIDLKDPGGRLKKLVKTPALSAFLVRSKYDYLHGTKLAFSASGQ